MPDQEQEQVIPPGRLGMPGKRLALAYKQRKAKAVRLRTFGWTYEEIAKELGLSAGAVATIIRREFARLDMEIKRGCYILRGLQLEQDQVAIKAIMPLVEAGDLAAIDRMLAIQTRVAKLCGLDLAGDQHTHQSITQIQLVEKVVVNAPGPLPLPALAAPSEQALQVISQDTPST